MAEPSQRICDGGFTVEDATYKDCMKCLLFPPNPDNCHLQAAAIRVNHAIIKRLNELEQP